MSPWVEAIAWWRYALLLVSLAWAFACLRSRSGRGAPALGLLFVMVATAPFGLGLARPYGLFEDAAATRRIAELEVAAASGAVGSAVAGEAAEHAATSWLPRTRGSTAVLVALGRLAPGIALAALGLVVSACWRRREAAALAGVLVWLASTGDLDAVRGGGFLPGVWARPEASLGLPVLVGLTLLAARLARPLRYLALGFPLLALWAVAPAQDLSGADVWLLLTFDAAPWILLAGFTLRRERDLASLALIGGGAAIVALGAAAGSGADLVIGHALYRVGLQLSAALALAPLLARIGAALIARRPIFFAGRAPSSVGLAVLIAALAPTSFLAWWDPSRTDPVYRLSLDPVSPALDPVMAFIRNQTPKDAVFVASADYAPMVAVLGGRRVLRAPSLLTSADDARRQRAERAILEGRPVPLGAEAHGARFVMIAPGDFKAHGIARPEDLDGRSGLERRYADDAGYRVYEYSR